MRHAVDDMDARTECMETMRELFRQFMSVLIREKIKLEQNHIYLDQRISFNEIDRYFFSGGACAYFQIAADIFTNLVYNPQEWSEDVVGNEEPKYVANFSIWLTYVPSDSILNVIKLLRNQFQFSLKDATSLTKNTPSLLFENSSKEYFYEIKPLFDEYEAIITIKPKQA
jgi:ribosomal protein L7/L12